IRSSGAAAAVTVAAVPAAALEHATAGSAAPKRRSAERRSDRRSGGTGSGSRPRDRCALLRLCALFYAIPIGGTDVRADGAPAYANERGGEVRRGVRDLLERLPPKVAR